MNGTSVAAPLEAEGLTKRFAGRVLFAGLDLALAPATLTALVGPSGIGKTTLLRILAGLDLPDAGRVSVRGAIATEGARLVLEPYERGIGMVFQQPALWPHMSVGDQVAFGLWRLAATDARERRDAALRLAEIADLADARPDRLSGGEAARVALARALAPRPACLLLDEPLAHLDAPLRRGLAATIRRAATESGAAVLIVTHAPDDLVGLVDRTLRLDGGRLSDVAG